MVGHMDCGYCGGRHSAGHWCSEKRQAAKPIEGIANQQSSVPGDVIFRATSHWNRKYLTITAEGRIIIEEGITMDEAARGFIEALRNLGATVTVVQEHA